MAFEDKTLLCAECGKDFVFSAEEQEAFHSKGHIHDPKRCLECREARKASRVNRGSDNNGRRQMFPAVCAECGKETEVPFEPRGDRPVYCNDCYRRMRPR